MATSIFTAYTLGTLLPYTIRDLNTSDPRSRNVMDPQEIVIIALYVVFHLWDITFIISQHRSFFSLHHRLSIIAYSFDTPWTINRGKHANTWHEGAGIKSARSWVQLLAN